MVAYVLEGIKTQKARVKNGYVLNLPGHGMHFIPKTGRRFCRRGIGSFRFPHTQIDPGDQPTIDNDLL